MDPRANSARWSFIYPLFVGLAFGVLAVTGGRIRWLAAALRMFIGFAFFSAVCDRFGVWGGPGSPGVSWGNFPIFVRYTAQVNAFLPWTVIPALAVIETILEGSLGVAMVAGWRVRQAVPASALLLAAFFAAMTISLGFTSLFPYAVPVMAAGAWLLTITDTSAFSVDRAMTLHRSFAV